MTALQPVSSRCPWCDGVRVVTATESPWEFTWVCQGCQAHGVTSWAHAEPPPVFAEPLEEQKPLPW